MADTPNYDRGWRFAVREWNRLGDLAKLSPAVRTLLLVSAAQGVIDNGGLQYFFESDYEGQPHYSEFVEGYRAIGANKEGDALAAAVALFPFSEPHLERTLRDEFLTQFLHENSHIPSSPFEPLTDVICGSKDVYPLLDKYVEEHGDEFPGDEPGPDRRSSH